MISCVIAFLNCSSCSFLIIFSVFEASISDCFVLLDFPYSFIISLFIFRFVISHISSSSFVLNLSIYSLVIPIFPISFLISSMSVCVSSPFLSFVSHFLVPVSVLHSFCAFSILFISISINSSSSMCCFFCSYFLISFVSFSVLFPSSVFYS